MRLSHLIAELDAMRARYGGQLEVILEHNGEPVNVTGLAILPALPALEIRHDASEPLPRGCIHHVERS